MCLSFANTEIKRKVPNIWINSDIFILEYETAKSNLSLSSSSCGSEKVLDQDPPSLPPSLPPRIQERKESSSSSSDEEEDIKEKVEEEFPVKEENNISKEADKGEEYSLIL